jgi:hypothetical protein
MQQEERLAKLKKQPTFWRTILVDPDTGLPAYQNDALANQLDSPLWKMHFTYPRDITIEPPAR